MVKFVYGLSTAYKALQAKDAQSLYFLTDTKQIYKGDVLVADSNVRFVTDLPSTTNTEPGYLYIYSDASGKASVYANINGTVVQVGGGEAAEIKDGIITISKFAEGTIASNLDNPDDATLPTTKAVSDAITSVKETLEQSIAGLDVAFVDVSAAAHSDAGTVLTFTTKGGDTKEVTVADLFLKSASYDASTHKLALTVQGAADPVEVDLSDLVGASLSDVIVGSDEEFTVELGAGATLGGFKTGDKIAKDTSLETIVKKMLMKQVAPTYSQPSVSIANNGGTSAGNYEIGTSVTPKLTSTFTKNDAGALASIQFKKGGTNVGTAGTTSPATYTEDAFVLSTAVTYTATATYAEGAIKNDNLGEPYPTGHIAAGSKNSGNYTFTPYRQGHFMGSVVSTETPTSATIRGLGTKKNGSYSAGTVRFTVAKGATQVIIACPATSRGMTKVINESALNADVTSTFTKTTVAVEGANGYEAVNYNVWTFVPPEAYGQAANLAVTLG